MYKFFIKSNQIYNNIITIIGEDINHITNVLRLKRGDKIKVCDQDTFCNYIVKINEQKKDKIECIIIEKIYSNSESNVNINIFQGIPKLDKMEDIIQKCTEIRS